MRDRNGNTALHLACQNGDLQCVKEILTKPETHLQFTQQDLEQWNYDGMLNSNFYIFIIFKFTAK